MVLSFVAMFRCRVSLLRRATKARVCTIVYTIAVLIGMTHDDFGALAWATRSEGTAKHSWHNTTEARLACIAFLLCIGTNGHITAFCTSTWKCFSIRRARHVSTFTYCVGLLCLCVLLTHVALVTVVPCDSILAMVLGTSSSLHAALTLKLLVITRAPGCGYRATCLCCASARAGQARDPSPTAVTSTQPTSWQIFLKEAGRKTITLQVSCDATFEEIQGEVIAKGRVWHACDSYLRQSGEEIEKSPAKSSMISESQLRPRKTERD